MMNFPCDRTTGLSGATPTAAGELEHQGVCRREEPVSALATNVGGGDVESGASLARAQDEGVVGPYLEDEDPASRVPGRQNGPKVGGRGTSQRRDRADI